MVIFLILISLIPSIIECHYIPDALLANNTEELSKLCLCKSPLECEAPDLYQNYTPSDQQDIFEETVEALVLTINGKEREKISFNHHVTIEEDKDSECTETHRRCSGILISDLWILTSVTCLLQLKSTMDKVKVQGSPSNEPDIIGRVRAISSNSGYFTIGSSFRGYIAPLQINLIIQHPRFNPDHVSNGYDIALLRLEQSAMTRVNWRVKPVCLPFVEQHHAVLRWLARQPKHGYISTLYTFGRESLAGRVCINFALCSERDIMRHNQIKCVFNLSESMRDDWGVPLTVLARKYNRQILIGTGSDVLLTGKSIQPKQWQLIFSNIARSIKWIILTIARNPAAADESKDLTDIDD